jgi:hypothetical protein
MRMSITRVALQLLEHRITERALREHAFNGVLEYTIRILGVHLVECSFVDAAWETGVAEIGFLSGFIASHTQFVDIGYDDEITGIHVWRKNGFVFAAQTKRNLARQSAEHLIGAIKQEPILFDISRFGGISFHSKRTLNSIGVVQSAVIVFRKSVAQRVMSAAQNTANRFYYCRLLRVEP